MNITHINDKDIDIPSSDKIFEGIFKRQGNLHTKYKPMEEKNDIGLALIKNIPFSLDDPKCQYILKDFAWRITEEITESMEAHDPLHKIEELIDALHFYTEMLIICGFNENDIKFSKKDVNIIDPIYFLGLACNLLKNKPWKNTHLITDKKRFKTFLLSGYNRLLNNILKEVKTFENLYCIYYKKSLVNTFRIRSNY